MTKISTSPK